MRFALKVSPLGLQYSPTPTPHHLFSFARFLFIILTSACWSSVPCSPASKACCVLKPHARWGRQGKGCEGGLLWCITPNIIITFVDTNLNSFFTPILDIDAIFHLKLGHLCNSRIFSHFNFKNLWCLFVECWEIRNVSSNTSTVTLLLEFVPKKPQPRMFKVAWSWGWYSDFAFLENLIAISPSKRFLMHWLLS